MPDSLGPIPIPDPPVIPPFPLRSDYGTGMDLEPPIAVHTFDQPGLRMEQRFVLGNGARRFRVQKSHLSCEEYDLLKAHWQQAQGLYAEFDYDYPGPGGLETYRVRYADPTLSFDHMVGMIVSVGIMLVEVAVTTASYTTTGTVDRFPDTALEESLSNQVNTLIPLIEIQGREFEGPLLRLSDRRVTVDGELYLPRLVTWSGISQSIGESSDSARFEFGNADGVWTQLVNTDKCNLYRATVALGFLHVESGVLIRMWAGYALQWRYTQNATFEIPASDGVFELSLGYPARLMSRMCWKVYKGRFCPSVSAEAECPKSFEACMVRGVKHSFGGTVAGRSLVKLRDNSTGTFGFGRSTMFSATIMQDTIYQRAIQEVYTDKEMKMPADIAMAREEGDFVAAIGVVGEGPIGRYHPDVTKHRLNESIPHDPLARGGFRGILGNDPAGEMDFFALDQAPWNVAPPNATWAAGLAFAEIRRVDEEGIQLNKLLDQSMTVTILQGIGGWEWTAPGTRVWTAPLRNCIWVLINVYLRGIGLRVQPSNEAEVPVGLMEQYFDVQAAILAADRCNEVVPKIVGEGDELQFPFRGILKERKPLKDWMQEIANCCLGYFTFSYGKLYVGIRFNSSVLFVGNGYNRNTILYKSLQATPVQPRFNWLTVQFGDEEFDWDLNSVTIYDMDAATLAGTPESPQYQAETMSLVGVSNKSQAARIATTRLREEVGGLGKDEQRFARNISFRTTVLGLQTMVGDIISLEHDDLPLDPVHDPLHYVEGRVTKWVLNPDYSIDITATRTTEDMYDLVKGPKPDDVMPPGVIPEILPTVRGITWMPNGIAPFTGDPIYTDPLERTFQLLQDYAITREGIWDPALYVTGEGHINKFLAAVQPRIVGITLDPGGTLDGGITVYAVVTQRDATGQPILPSNLSGIWIAPGLVDQKLVLNLAPVAGYAGWDLWVGLDRRAIAWQTGADGDLPATLEFPGPIHRMTRGLPEATARRVRIAAKHVWHSGIAGVLVTGVSAPNRIQANDFIGSADAWIGRYLTCIADQSDGSAPLWNFEIVAFDSALGTFTVTPDCVRENPPGTPAPQDSVEPGDVLIMRSIATAADATSVTDSMWNNSIAVLQFGSPGLRPDEEIGRVVRIWRGKGAGQFRRIVGNTDIKIDVDPPWEIIPDTTSIIFVETAEWTYTDESSDLIIPRPGGIVTLRMRVDNLRDRVALVAGFLVDDRDRQSVESLAPMREIYIFGQPPTVRVVGPDVGPWQALATDHTIRADTTDNDVTIELPPLYVYQGRPLLIVNDGANTVRIEAYAGETFNDGSAFIELTTQGESIRLTAG